MKPVDNFDAKKWLVENKITTQSRLNEEDNSDYNQFRGKAVRLNFKDAELTNDAKRRVLDFYKDTFPNDPEMQKRYEEYWLGWKPKNKTIMRFNPNRNIYVGRNELSRSNYQADAFEYNLSDFKNVKISPIN